MYGAPYKQNWKGRLKLVGIRTISICPARDRDVMIHVTTFYKTWSINAWLL
jgi:hypothetical protein